MKFERIHLTWAIVALLAVACLFAVVAGHPVTSFLPHDLVSGVGLAGMGFAGVYKNHLYNILPKQPGGKTVVTLAGGPNAPTIDTLIFTLGGAAGPFTVSKITSITGKVDGSIVYYEADGTTHNKRRAYMGLPTSTTKLVIDLNEPNARSGIEQNLSSWPLSLMKKATFELMIDPAAGADMTLDCQAVFREPTNNPFIKKMRSDTFVFGGGGAHNIQVPSGPSGGKLVRVWIRESVAGNVTAATLRSKNAIGIEGTRAELQDRQSDWALVPQAGVLVLDFIEDGNLNGWFDTSNKTDCVLLMTGTAACTYSVDWEFLDPIGRL